MTHAEFVQACAAIREEALVRGFPDLSKCAFEAGAMTAAGIDGGSLVDEPPQ